jgi:hypothetical protein
VHRGEWRQCEQGIEDRIGDFHRVHEIATTVNNPVADDQKLVASQISVDPFKEAGEQNSISVVTSVRGPIEEDIARDIFDGETGVGILFIQKAFAE